MAVTKTLTLVSIQDAGQPFDGKVFIGTVNLTIQQDGTTIFNQNFSAQYKIIAGQTVDERLAEWAKKIREQIQFAINCYVNERNLFDNPKVGTAINWINNSLDISKV